MEGCKANETEMSELPWHIDAEGAKNMQTYLKEGK